MRRSALLALGLAMGCGEGTPVAATSRCAAPPAQPSASGCAILTGYAIDLQDRILDGLEGSLRPSVSCACLPQGLQFDERGIFSTTVYRRGSGPDTATVTAVLLAVAPKYPRHATGAPYFDTASVVLRFVPIGRSPEPQEVRLRIPLPLPTGGS